MRRTLRWARKWIIPFWAGILLVLVLPVLLLAEEAEPKAEPVLIEKIVIEGAPGREASIKGQMRVKEGKRYEAEELARLIDKDVEHLYRFGVFVRRIRPRRPAGEITLTLDVEERLRIASIDFEGLDAFEEDEILPLLLVKEGSPTDKALLRLACEQLKDYYSDEGYRFASVTDTIKRLPGGRVQLVFRIHEGPRTRVEDILFVGNRSIRSSRLRSVMETKRSDLFQAERLEEETFRRDLAALEQYYREEGWRDAEVFLENLVYSDDRSALTVVIRVREGKRYVVESVDVEGNEEIDKKTLMDLVKLRPGMFYRAPLVFGNVMEEEKGDFKRILEAYGELGYLTPDISPAETFDHETKRVRVVYRIKEGEKTRIRRVLIRGNEKTRDDVIRRLTVIRPGEIPRRSDIERSYKRLLQTRYFGKIEPKFLDTENPGEKDLLFEVEEMRTGDIRFIAAYNQSTQFMGRIAVRFRNFDIARIPTSLTDLISGRAFAGGGQTLTVQVTAGMEKQVIYNLKFEEPHLFGTRTSMSLNFFRFQRDWGPYLERRLGANLVLGRRLNRFLSASLKYRIEGLELRDISLFAPPDVYAARGPDTISSLTGKIALDLAERDPFGQPYSGVDADLSYEYAGGFLLGTVDFHKAELSARAYTTLFGDVSEWRHIMKVQAKVGWGGTHHHADQIPIYERFYVGGLGTVRGFEYRSIGPRQNGEPVGGNFMVSGGIEYSVPLYRAPMAGSWQQEMDVLRMVFFYDVGLLVADEEAYATRHFRSGIGFGFRLRVPALGGIPIALDFGWPISRRPEDRTERVSFSLGFFFF